MDMFRIGNRIFGNSEFRASLVEYKDARTAMLYEYGTGKLLKYFKNDVLYPEEPYNAMAKSLFGKMRDLEMFSVAKELYYEKFRFRGVVVDKIEGSDLSESLQTGGCVSDRIMSGCLLSRDLQKLNSRGIVWGDIHLENIRLGLDGNCYGMDVNEVYRKDSSSRPMHLYDIYYFSNKRFSKVPVCASDSAKLIVSMACYIFQFDFQSYVKTYGLENVLKVMFDHGVLKYIRDELVGILEGGNGLYYHDLVDKLLSYSDDEYTEATQRLRLQRLDS